MTFQLEYEIFSKPEDAESFGILPVRHEVFHEIYHQKARVTNGYLARNQTMWEEMLEPPHRQTLA